MNAPVFTERGLFAVLADGLAPLSHAWIASQMHLRPGLKNAVPVMRVAPIAKANPSQVGMLSQAERRILRRRVWV